MSITSRVTYSLAAWRVFEKPVVAEVDGSGTVGGVTASAEGVRVAWEQVPGSMRAAIEDVCGARVVEAWTQPGGFSPGLAFWAPSSPAAPAPGGGRMRVWRGFGLSCSTGGAPSR